MRLYQLCIAPGEYEVEGEDHDEWFMSLKAAKARRAELIAENPELTEHRFGEDFAISAVDVKQLSPRNLALAILNRSGWQKARREVVAAYKPARKSAADDSIDSTTDGS
jgi:predicted RNase H-like nuclease